MKSLVRIFSLIMIFAMLAACSPAAPAPAATAAPTAVPTMSPQETWLKAAELGQYAPAKQDWAAIEAAAKKEGKLVVYANTSKVADIVPLFEKAYGIKIEAPDISGDDVLQKTKEEQKAGAFYEDVWYSSSAAGDMIGELLPKHYVWNFVPEDLVSVTPESARTPVLTVKFGVKVMAYNSELNPKGCPVTNLWDLTDAAWKGKMFIEDPLNDSSQMALLLTIVNHPKEMADAYKAKFGKDPVLEADTPDAGWLWLKMLAKNKPIAEPGGDELMAAFAAPKMKDSYIAINASYSKYSDVLKGKLFFEPCKDMKPMVGIQSSSYLAIANQAPHPNAAKLFIKWLTTTPEAFAPWNTMGSYSPRSDWAAIKGAIPYKDIAPLLWTADELSVYKSISKVRDFYALNLLK
jgi:iron(III) transport system substrate-binding protein